MLWQVQRTCKATESGENLHLICPLANPQYFALTNCEHPSKCHCLLLIIKKEMLTYVHLPMKLRSY